MGITSSAEMAEGGIELQSQGDDNLWTVVLEGSEDGRGERVCLFSRTPGEGAVATRCKGSTESLRILRHPNILKFLECEATPEVIAMVTEPVVPLHCTLKEMSLDGIVMGWRGVGAGLSFLHDRAGMSHNNVWPGCVYVNTMDSQWKVGGLEAAARYKDISAAFLSSISGFRHSKAVPPEDKSASVAAKMVPVHARDVWALGNFFLAVIEEVGLEAELRDETFQYISDQLLNPDPSLRPTVSEILLEPWMSNVSSLLIDFLSNFTLKTRKEKDVFFCSLPEQLHSLSSQVLAENVVPLLVMPLIVAEPLARDTLWKHLLTPISSDFPRRKVFSSAHVCPLLDEELFKAHLLPLLLNLMESRDLHVRVLLLQHLGSFVSLCNQDDLVGVVLPEVLIGLNDTSDKMVRATLHALAELVPYVGAELVMGTSRKKIFTDAQPRVESPSVAHEVPSPQQQSGTVDLPGKSPGLCHGNTEPSQPSVSQPTKSRDERMRQMREKREKQRLKKQNQKKIGLAVSNKDLGEADASQLPFNADLPQYSPSISHDEVDQDVSGESGASNMGSDLLSRHLIATPTSEVAGREDGFDDEELEKESGEEEVKEEGEDDWDESWSDVEDLSNAKFGTLEETREKFNSFPQPEQTELAKQTTAPSPSLKSSKLFLKVNESKEIGESSKSSTKKKSMLWEEFPAAGEVEEELDLFADMAPKFPTRPTGSIFSSSVSPQVKSSSSSSAPVVAKTKAADDSTANRSSLNYHPQEEEPEGAGWGDDDWENGF